MHKSQINPENIIAIHSQSNRNDSQPLQFEGDPAEQAFDSRALCLPNLGQLCVSAPIEVAYLEYYVNILKQDLPQIIVPKKGLSLSKALLSDETSIQQISAFSKSGRRKIVSFFDSTPTEAKFYRFLKDRVPNIINEVDFDLADELGNKKGFQDFCRKFDIPQLPGGSFSNLYSLLTFIDHMLASGKDVIVKHPLGTAGEGLTIVNKQTKLSQFKKMWKSWIKDCGAIVAEEFSQKGSEHALHIYIDPITKKMEITGVYEQLVHKGADTLSHYGCKYSPTYMLKDELLIKIAKKQIMPALKEVGYTGPACFDVLKNPTHFMELNVRAGANMYVHRMVEKVVASVYGLEKTKSVPFMFLTGIDSDNQSFFEFLRKNQTLILPQRNKMLIFTNPGRQAFGKFDVVSIHLDSLELAEENLFNGLVQMVGKSGAIESFEKIYQRG